MTKPNRYCPYCGEATVQTKCPGCRYVQPTPENDHDDEVAISKALADPRFDAEFDRIFGKRWR